MTLREAIKAIWPVIEPEEDCSQHAECSIVCPVCQAASDMHVRGEEPELLTHEPDCPVPFLEEYLREQVSVREELGKQTVLPSVT